jgi:hypothetical protein
VLKNATILLIVIAALAAGCAGTYDPPVDNFPADAFPTDRGE